MAFGTMVSLLLALQRVIARRRSPDSLFSAPDLYYAGQSGSCAARTGYSTCAAYVAAAPASAFSEAYWTLRSVQVYKAGRKPRAVYASTAGAAPTTAA